MLVPCKNKLFYVKPEYINASYHPENDGFEPTVHHPQVQKIRPLATLCVIILKSLPFSKRGKFPPCVSVPKTDSGKDKKIIGKGRRC